MCRQPLRTESSASLQMRSKDWRIASRPPLGSKVQSMRATVSPMYLRIASNSALSTIGDCSDSISLWSGVSSRILPRLPSRVRIVITLRSRKESIGGLVTWLKFCRK